MVYKVIMTILIGICIPTSCWASEPATWQLSAGLFSRYVFRGQDLTDRPVLQSNIEYAAGSLAAGLWANQDLTNINDRCGDMTEIDYYIGWSGKVPRLPATNYELGVIIYDFHGRSASGSRVLDTTELYCTVTWKAPLNPSLSAFVDLDEADGCYLCLGLEHSLPIGATLAANLGWGSSPYNYYYWGLRGELFNDLTVKLCYPISAGRWTICPSLSYVTILSSQLRSTQAYGPDGDLLIAGLSAQYTL